MHETIRARRTTKRHVALAWELAPIAAPAFGFGVTFVMYLVASTLGNPPYAVMGLLILLLVGCFLVFCLAGLGWIYIGETKIGVTILVLRGVAMLAFTATIMKIAGEVDCGTACGDYSIPFATLGAVGVITPLLSTVALAVKLSTQRT